MQNLEKENAKDVESGILTKISPIIQPSKLDEAAA
jgi:hypothetical protein